MKGVGAKGIFLGVLSAILLTIPQACLCALDALSNGNTHSTEQSAPSCHEEAASTQERSPSTNECCDACNHDCAQIVEVKEFALSDGIATEIRYDFSLIYSVQALAFDRVSVLKKPPGSQMNVFRIPLPLYLANQIFLL